MQKPRQLAMGLRTKTCLAQPSSPAEADAVPEKVFKHPEITGTK